jgi:uncharacterized repeat protein (TIGR04052 family)
MRSQTPRAVPSLTCTALNGVARAAFFGIFVMNTSSVLSLSLIAAAAATLVACGGGDDGPKAVELQFAAMAGNTAIGCGSTVTGLGSTAATGNVKDFRFYISQVKMIRADGVEVPLTLTANDSWNYTAGADSVTLVDLENASGDCPTATGTTGTNAVVKGTVPAGTYTGVKMTMGVPFSMNHTDWANPTTTKAPLDIQSMAWNWQGGRKFAKIEVTNPAWTSPTFNFHLGSTGCIGNPATGTQVSSCSAPNRMDVKFATFDPATQKIAVDIKPLLDGTNVTINQAAATGCMSGGTDPECLNVFKALAIDWKADGTGTGLPINGGAAQTLFRAIAK